MSRLRTWYLTITRGVPGAAVLALVVMVSFYLSYFTTQHFFHNPNWIGREGYRVDSHGIAAYDFTLTEQYVFQITNLVRSSCGLSPMDNDPVLWKVAQARSQDMVRRAYFSHYDPQTDECLARLLLKEMGTSPVRIGEVILLVTPTHQDVSPLVQAAEMVQDWLDSPPHRDALLDPDYTQAGVGISLTEQGQLVATQILAAPESSQRAAGKDQ